MQRRFWVCIYPLTMCWTWERDSAISEAQNMFWSPKSSMSYARAPFRVLNHPFRLLLWEHTYIEWQTVKSVRFRAIRFDTIVAHPFQKCENYRKSTTNAEPQKNGSSDTNAERKRDRTSVRKRYAKHIVYMLVGAFRILYSFGTIAAEITCYVLMMLFAKPKFDVVLKSAQ